MLLVNDQPTTGEFEYSLAGHIHKKWYMTPFISLLNDYQFQWKGNWCSFISATEGFCNRGSNHSVCGFSLHPHGVRFDWRNKLHSLDDLQHCARGRRDPERSPDCVLTRVWSVMRTHTHTHIHTYTCNKGICISIKFRKRIKVELCKK